LANLTDEPFAAAEILATTSTDGTGTLWDLASRRPIGATMSGASGDPIDAAFLHGGSDLAVVHEDEIVVWDVRPDSWTRHACAVAGRTLTRAEWENALPRHDYSPGLPRAALTRSCGRRLPSRLVPFTGSAPS
jgi:hypothetical protein